MSRFDDRLKNARDQQFQQRVAMAALAMARRVLREPKDTPEHDARVEIAKSVIFYGQYLSGGPLDQLFNLIAADGKTNLATPDDELFAEVDSLWDFLGSC